MSTTFTALAYNIVFLRERGVLKRIRGTPLPTISYFGGVAANAVTNTALQIVIIVLAGRALFGIDWPPHVGELIVFVVVGVVAFAALGVAFAHVIPNFESPLRTSTRCSCRWCSCRSSSSTPHAPGFLQTIADALPLAPLIKGLSGAMVAGSGLGGHLDALAVIALRGAGGIYVAVRGFSWSSRGPEPLAQHDLAERRVDRLERVRAERDPGRARVRANLLGPARADDRRGDVGLAQHPRERELRHA